MRQKILHPGCSPQSGKASGLGEFPHVEAGNKTRQNCVHTPPTHQASEVCRCSAGNEKTAEKAANAPELGRLSKAAIALPVMLIRLYQIAISPWLGACCRFTPSCSNYALNAFKTHGFWRGGMLTAFRLLRCQPFCKGGHDPVPPRKNGSN